MSEVESLRQQLEESLLNNGSPSRGTLLTKWTAFRQAVQSRIERETSRSRMEREAQALEDAELTEAVQVQQRASPGTPTTSRLDADSFTAIASRGSPILPLNAHTGLYMNPRLRFLIYGGRLSSS